MNQEERKHLAAKMKRKLERLEDQISHLQEQTKPIAPENAIGRVSRMDAINNKSVNEATLRQALARREGIRTALERIDDPEFGNCERCGEAIPMGRLLLMPESPRCVRCAG